MLRFLALFRVAWRSLWNNFTIINTKWVGLSLTVSVLQHGPCRTTLAHNNLLAYFCRYLSTNLAFQHIFQSCCSLILLFTSSSFQTWKLRWINKPLKKLYRLHKNRWPSMNNRLNKSAVQKEAPATLVVEQTLRQHTGTDRNRQQRHAS